MISVTSAILAVMVISTQPTDPLTAQIVKQCHQRAETQRDLNRCGGLGLRLADQELNATYQAVIEAHKEDQVFITKLRIAQRMWLQFRDAEMEAIFPHKDDPRHYGSVFPLCWSTHLATITKERTKQLRRWIDGVPEGDLCAGSFPYAGR